MLQARATEHHVYEGAGDDLSVDTGTHIVLLPDVSLAQRDLDSIERIRIMWGQRLIDDLIAGRYRALVCAVNAVDNSHGIISTLALRLPTSQWNQQSITDYASHFVRPSSVTVVKFDMDCVHVLGLLRPSQHEHLTMDDLAHGFQIVSAMLKGRPDRWPVASVCFLGARANKLAGPNGHEPSFECVLDTMYHAGYRGDIYPAPWMWDSAPAGVFPRYPFPDSFKHMCEGGF